MVFPKYHSNPIMLLTKSSCNTKAWTREVLLSLMVGMAFTEGFPSRNPSRNRCSLLIPLMVSL